ncbi:hypothetical protein ACIQVL_41010 [Streptomyces sp. NPDC090499]|uniref:hypothetical protein n=1 Tax=unclassified Streptomyces TaxID=2593676 RepID=UPI00382B6D05
MTTDLRRAPAVRGGRAGQQPAHQSVPTGDGHATTAFPCGDPDMPGARTPPEGPPLWAGR